MGRPLQPRIHPLDHARARHHSDRPYAALIHAGGTRDLLRREASASLPTLLDDLATWVDIDALAWGQRYAVVAACRILYTLETAKVASKPSALEWALRTLDPRWRPLLGQVRDERPLGWDPHRAPRPREADTARDFVSYALDRTVRADRLNVDV